MEFDYGGFYNIQKLLGSKINSSCSQELIDLYQINRYLSNLLLDVNDKVSESSYINIIKKYSNSFNDNINFINENSSETLKFIINIINNSRNFNNYILYKTPKLYNVIQLFEVFAKNINDDYYNTFRSLIDNKKILFSSEPLSAKERLSGLAFPMYGLNSGFIRVYYPYCLKKIHTISHEVAHIDQLCNIQSIQAVSRLSTSLFKESYAEFIGNLFLRYLLNTKYYKNAYNLINNEYTGLSIMCDKLVPFVKNLDLMRNEKENPLNVSIGTFMHLYSFALAEFLTSEYEQNPSSSFIDDTKNILNNYTDDEIINYFGVDNIFTITKKRLERSRR